MTVTASLIATVLVLLLPLSSSIAVVIRRMCQPIASAGFIVLAVAIVVMGTGCGGTELLQNGDFESGDELGGPAGWNITWGRDLPDGSKAERVPATGGATGKNALALTRPPTTISASQKVDFAGQDIRDYVVEASLAGVARAPDQLVQDVFAIYDQTRQRLSRVSHPGNGKWTVMTASVTIPPFRLPDALDFVILRQGKSDGEMLVDNAALRIRRKSFFRDKVPPSPIDLAVSFVCASVSVVLMTIFFRKVWTKSSPFRSTIINGLVLFVTLLYLVLGAESFTRLFLIQSDSTAPTLVTRLWLSRYWHPINSDGYRDVEHDKADFIGRQVLFTVGDSFAAGYGITDVKDVCARVLQRELGADWRVVNISKSGWSTKEEYEAVVSYPQKPDVVVLAHVFNDIVVAAKKSGFVRPPLPEPSEFATRITERSYFLDFAYWRTRVLVLRTHKSRAFLRGCYENAVVWQEHEKRLDKFVKWADDEDVKLVVVMFPWLRNIAASELGTTKVTSFFRTRDIPVIDLAGVFAGRKPSRLVVNGFDAHPNESVHEEVAGLLLDMVLDE